MTPNEEITLALKSQEIDSKIRSLEKEVTDLRGAVIEMKKERENLMKWGILSLGAAVVGMGLYIWHLFTNTVAR